MRQIEQLQNNTNSKLSPDAIMSHHSVDELMSKPAENEEEAIEQAEKLATVFGHIIDWNNPAVYTIFEQISASKIN